VIERAALLSGTVGAGKTTIGEELAGLLKDRGEPHAFIDLDRLSELWPAPEDDRFNGRLILANLAAITRNFAAAGARSLVMSGVVESATSVEKYRMAIGGCPLTVVRITASLESIADRLQKRHEYWDADGLAWHLDRAPELEAALDASGLCPIVISNDGHPHEAAALLLDRLGWLETA